MESNVESEISAGGFLHSCMAPRPPFNDGSNPSDIDVVVDDGMFPPPLLSLLVSRLELRHLFQEQRETFAFHMVEDMLHGPFVGFLIRKSDSEMLNRYRATPSQLPNTNQRLSEACSLCCIRVRRVTR